jgi:DNA-binding NarL/FixJ family response regulator
VSKIKVLLIDDQPESVEPLRQELSKLDDVECEVMGFAGAEAALEERNPQIVVLDLLEGSGVEPEAAGLKTCDYIWNNKFCPLVVYTAAPERVENSEVRDHPFVRVVQKGSGSEITVTNRVKEFRPQVDAFDQVSKEIRSVMNKALKSVAPRIMKPPFDSSGTDMLIRAARRLVAARMDETLSTGEPPPLKSWEFYICPPLVQHLLTGDIVRRKGGNKEDPTSYAVVLTPSCEMVKDSKRKPKVKEVLLARCAPVQRLLADLLIPSNAAKKNKEKIKSMLSQGFTQSCIAIASLPGEFPAMAADFRSLELAKLDSDMTGLDQYERVASVDNPLREAFAWAYMVATARPALPDRDRDDWADAIVAAVGG